LPDEGPVKQLPLLGSHGRTQEHVLDLLLVFDIDFGKSGFPTIFRQILRQRIDYSVALPGENVLRFGRSWAQSSVEKSVGNTSDPFWQKANIVYSLIRIYLGAMRHRIALIVDLGQVTGDSIQ
jgi:hypothetical protein